MINTINIEEIINVINDYIVNNYEYDYADIRDDTISCHYTNKNCEEDIVNIYVSLEKGSE